MPSVRRFDGMDGFPPAPALVSVSAKRTAPVSGPVVSLFIYAMSKCHAAKFIIQHLRKGLRMGAGRTPLDTPGMAKGPTEASFANVRMFVESVILGHTHTAYRNGIDGGSVAVRSELLLLLQAPSAVGK